MPTISHTFSLKEILNWTDVLGWEILKNVPPELELPISSVSFDLSPLNKEGGQVHLLTLWLQADLSPKGKDVNSKNTKVFENFGGLLEMEAKKEEGSDHSGSADAPQYDEVVACTVMKIVVNDGAESLFSSADSFISMLGCLLTSSSEPKVSLVPSNLTFTFDYRRCRKNDDEATVPRPLASTASTTATNDHSCCSLLNLGCAFTVIRMLDDSTGAFSWDWQLRIFGDLKLGDGSTTTTTDGDDDGSGGVLVGGSATLDHFNKKLVFKAFASHLVLHVDGNTKVELVNVSAEIKLNYLKLSSLEAQLSCTMKFDDDVTFEAGGAASTMGIGLYARVVAPSDPSKNLMDEVSSLLKKRFGDKASSKSPRFGDKASSKSPSILATTASHDDTCNAPSSASSVSKESGSLPIDVREVCVTFATSEFTIGSKKLSKGFGLCIDANVGPKSCLFHINASGQCDKEGVVLTSKIALDSMASLLPLTDVKNAGILNISVNLEATVIFKIGKPVSVKIEGTMSYDDRHEIAIEFAGGGEEGLQLLGSYHQAAATSTTTTATTASEQQQLPHHQPAAFFLYNSQKVEGSELSDFVKSNPLLVTTKTYSEGVHFAVRMVPPEMFEPLFTTLLGMDAGDQLTVVADFTSVDEFEVTLTAEEGKTYRLLGAVPFEKLSLTNKNSSLQCEVVFEPITIPLPTSSIFEDIGNIVFAPIRFESSVGVSVAKSAKLSLEFLQHEDDEWSTPFGLQNVTVNELGFHISVSFTTASVAVQGSITFQTDKQPPVFAKIIASLSATGKPNLLHLILKDWTLEAILELIDSQRSVKEGSKSQKTTITKTTTVAAFQQGQSVYFLYPTTESWARGKVTDVSTSTNEDGSEKVLYSCVIDQETPPSTTTTTSSPLSVITTTTNAPSGAVVVEKLPPSSLSEISCLTLKNLEMFMCAEPIQLFGKQYEAGVSFKCHLEFLDFVCEASGVVTETHFKIHAYLGEFTFKNLTVTGNNQPGMLLDAEVDLTTKESKLYFDGKIILFSSELSITVDISAQGVFFRGLLSIRGCCPKQATTPKVLESNTSSDVVTTTPPLSSGELASNSNSGGELQLLVKGMYDPKSCGFIVYACLSAEDGIFKKIVEFLTGIITQMLNGGIDDDQEDESSGPDLCEEVEKKQKSATANLQGKRVELKQLLNNADKLFSKAHVEYNQVVESFVPEDLKLCHGKYVDKLNDVTIQLANSQESVKHALVLLTKEVKNAQSTALKNIEEASQIKGHTGLLDVVSSLALAGFFGIGGCLIGRLYLSLSSDPSDKLPAPRLILATLDKMRLRAFTSVQMGMVHILSSQRSQLHCLNTTAQLKKTVAELSASPDAEATLSQLVEAIKKSKVKFNAHMAVGTHSLKATFDAADQALIAANEALEESSALLLEALRAKKAAVAYQKLTQGGLGSLIGAIASGLASCLSQVFDVQKIEFGAILAESTGLGARVTVTVFGQQLELDLGMPEGLSEASIEGIYIESGNTMNAPPIPSAAIDTVSSSATPAVSSSPSPSLEPYCIDGKYEVLQDGDIIELAQNDDHYVQVEHQSPDAKTPRFLSLAHYPDPTPHHAPPSSPPTTKFRLVSCGDNTSVFKLRLLSGEGLFVREPSSEAAISVGMVHKGGANDASEELQFTFRRSLSQPSIYYTLSTTIKGVEFSVLTVDLPSTTLKLFRAAESNSAQSFKVVVYRGLREGDVIKVIPFAPATKMSVICKRLLNRAANPSAAFDGLFMVHLRGGSDFSLQPVEEANMALDIEDGRIAFSRADEEKRSQNLRLECHNGTLMLTHEREDHSQKFALTLLSDKKKSTTSTTRARFATFNPKMASPSHQISVAIVRHACVRPGDIVQMSPNANVLKRLKVVSMSSSADGPPKIVVGDDETLHSRSALACDTIPDSQKFRVMMGPNGLVSLQVLTSQVNHPLFLGRNKNLNGMDKRTTVLSVRIETNISPEAVPFFVGCSVDGGDLCNGNEVFLVDPETQSVLVTKDGEHLRFVSSSYSLFMSSSHLFKLHQVTPSIDPIQFAADMFLKDTADHDDSNKNTIFGAMEAALKNVPPPPFQHGARMLLCGINYRSDVQDKALRFFEVSKDGKPESSPSGSTVVEFHLHFDGVSSKSGSRGSGGGCGSISYYYSIHPVDENSGTTTKGCLYWGRDAFIHLCSEFNSSDSTHRFHVQRCEESESLSAITTTTTSGNVRTEPRRFTIVNDGQRRVCQIEGNTGSPLSMRALYYCPVESHFYRLPLSKCVGTRKVPPFISDCLAFIKHTIDYYCSSVSATQQTTPLNHKDDDSCYVVAPGECVRHSILRHHSPPKCSDCISLWGTVISLLSLLNLSTEASLIPPEVMALSTVREDSMGGLTSVETGARHSITLQSKVDNALKETLEAAKVAIDATLGTQYVSTSKNPMRSVFEVLTSFIISNRESIHSRHAPTASNLLFTKLAVYTTCVGLAKYLGMHHNYRWGWLVIGQFVDCAISENVTYSDHWEIRVLHSYMKKCSIQNMNSAPLRPHPPSPPSLLEAAQIVLQLLDESDDTTKDVFGKMSKSTLPINDNDVCGRIMRFIDGCKSLTVYDTYWRSVRTKMAKQQFRADSMAEKYFTEFTNLMSVIEGAASVDMDPVWNRLCVAATEFSAAIKVWEEYPNLPHGSVPIRKTFGASSVGASQIGVVKVGASSVGASRPGVVNVGASSSAAPQMKSMSQLNKYAGIINEYRH